MQRKVPRKRESGNLVRRRLYPSRDLAGACQKSENDSIFDTATITDYEWWTKTALDWDSVHFGSFRRLVRPSCLCCYGCWKVG